MVQKLACVCLLCWKVIMYHVSCWLVFVPSFVVWRGCLCLNPTKFHTTSVVHRMEITPDPKRPRLDNSGKKAPRHESLPPSISSATILDGKVINTMAAELTSTLASGNKRLANPREHTFATMCSGSEICHEVLQALEQELGKIGIGHSFRQLFAAESVPKKQAWIAKVVRDPNICIFNDVVDLSKSHAWCVQHTCLCKVPRAELLVAGFSCKNLSRANSKRFQVKGSRLSEALANQSSSARTWLACVEYVRW